MDVIGAISSTYDAVLKIFSSSKKTEIVSKVTDFGFDHFSQTSTIEKAQGVDPDFFDAFRDHVIKNF
jgi:hypothetical protein